MQVSGKSKVIYLVMLILFLIGLGFFWLDSIGLINVDKFFGKVFHRESESVLYAGDDEPSLIAKEEFEKEKDRLQERIEELDRREALIGEQEKGLLSEKDKFEEMKRSLAQDQKKFSEEKNRYTGYRKNVADLANKIENMPPKDSVPIMTKWEDTLLIDVLRQMDTNAANAGRQTITAYLISLMPKDKAARIMYLMTQI
ncbi:MAG: periplasmic-type flagellar collar protein FlbB [Spirochaetota bacterium]